jgi:hypothetical protein
MTPESKSLQHFLQSNLAHKFTHIKHSRFSSSSETLLTTLFENIIEADKGFDSVDLVSGNIFKNEVPKGVHYKLCPEKARTHIENMNSRGQSCKFSINGRKVNIHLVVEGNSLRSFSTTFHRIYLLLHLLSKYSRKECSQTLTIYLFLTSMKKTLTDCDNDCSIGEDNANTAFTFSCKRINEVYLYRKEEWFKVLCHELFHSMGLDFSEFECEEVNAEMFKMIPIKTDLRLYEAYTELWGELLNAIFISYSSFKIGEPVSRMVRKLETLVYQERMFSVYQGSKVLTHFGMSYDDLYLPNAPAIQSRKHYKETTPILSYYIVKAVLMFHIYDFMDWCVEHNQSSLEFNKIDVNDTMKQFTSFIREHYRSESLVESMDQARTWFLKQEHTHRSDKTPIITMRMSLLEI